MSDLKKLVVGLVMGMLAVLVLAGTKFSALTEVTGLSGPSDKFLVNTGAVAKSRSIGASNMINAVMPYVDPALIPLPAIAITNGDTRSVSIAKAGITNGGIYGNAFIARTGTLGWSNGVAMSSPSAGEWRLLNGMTDVIVAREDGVTVAGGLTNTSGIVSLNGGKLIVQDDGIAVSGNVQIAGVLYGRAAADTVSSSNILNGTIEVEDLSAAAVAAMGGSGADVTAAGTNVMSGSNAFTGPITMTGPVSLASLDVAGELSFSSMASNSVHKTNLTADVQSTLDGAVMKGSSNAVDEAFMLVSPNWEITEDGGVFQTVTATAVAYVPLLEITYITWSGPTNGANMTSGVEKDLFYVASTDCAITNVNGVSATYSRGLNICVSNQNATAITFRMTDAAARAIGPGTTNALSIGGGKLGWISLRALANTYSYATAAQQ